ncbi:MAG: hypothetical protein ABIN80_22540 [Dyadobacter sp.]
MITILTVITALLAGTIPFLQVQKELVEKAEEGEREREVNKIYQKLQNKSDTIEAKSSSIEIKSDAIIELQAELGRRNENIISMQRNVIDLQNSLSEFVTGGDVTPTIGVFVRRRILSPAGGYTVMVFLENNGHIPLRDVRLDFSASSLSKGNFVNENSTTDAYLPFKESNPVSFATLPPGYRKKIYQIVVASAEIRTPIDQFYLTFDVIYNSNFYNVDAGLRINNNGIFSHQEVKYTRNMSPIEPNKYMKLKFTYDWIKPPMTGSQTP